MLKNNVACSIPLHNRAGMLVAHAVVDVEDYERVVAHGPWHRHVKGYVVCSKPGITRQIEVKLHRFILGLSLGDPGVDHKDRDNLNNRKQNLRVCSQAQNTQNTIGRPHTSPYRGVSWYKPRGKWVAQAQLGGKKKNLGYYEEMEEANRVAVAWRTAHMPFSEEHTP